MHYAGASFCVAEAAFETITTYRVELPDKNRDKIEAERERGAAVAAWCPRGGSRHGCPFQRLAQRSSPMSMRSEAKRMQTSASLDDMMSNRKRRGEAAGLGDKGQEGEMGGTSLLGSAARTATVRPPYFLALSCAIHPLQRVGVGGTMDIPQKHMIHDIHDSTHIIQRADQKFPPEFSIMAPTQLGL